MLRFWSPWSLPVVLPADALRVVRAMSGMQTRAQALAYAYGVVQKRFHGASVWSDFFSLFVDDFRVLWKKERKTHCTHLNQLLRVLLVQSGCFSGEDVRFRWTFIFLSPHQYLSVRVAPRRWIAVDPWGGTHGLPLGDYGHGFFLKREQKGFK